MTSEFELIEIGPCLICLDTGTVKIHDPRNEAPEIQRCPRGCPKQEMKACGISASSARRGTRTGPGPA